MRTYRQVLKDDVKGEFRHDWVRPEPHDTHLRCYVCPATLNLETRLDDACWDALKVHMKKCKSGNEAKHFLQALHVTATNLRRRTVGRPLPLANDVHREATVQSSLSDEYADCKGSEPVSPRYLFGKKKVPV